MTRLCVVTVSDAFRTFWGGLAADLAVAMDIVGPADPLKFRPDTVAVILAAGGAERDALQWLEANAAGSGLPTLVVGTDPGRRTAVELVARGARDYFALPEDLEMFRNAVAALVNSGRGRGELSADTRANAFKGIVGESAAMQSVLRQATRLVTHRNARALILGETGTGKELLARAIHQGGPRSGAPFVAVNCSALPEHLIESELFGHERGAFTDAHAAKPGLFEVANTGTLFLDEIGDLPLGVQAKLLRVLEDGQIRRVGGTRTRPVDVRILAATHQDLPARVHEKTFRQDLYFRLGPVTLTLPPLRDRGDDVNLIAEALLQRFAREHRLPVPTLGSDARQRLRAFAWPGNVRELGNAIERALLLSPTGELNADELAPTALAGPPAAQRELIPFPAPLFQITAAAAHATVKLCGGNLTASARRLSISPKRLRRLLTAGVNDTDLEPTALSM